MKSDAVFKRAFNDALSLLEALPPTAAFPSENQLSSQLRVSRTTVRKILAAMKELGFAPDGDRHQSLAAIPRFAEAETVTTSEQVETHFMEWMLRDNTRPGTSINELELARRFGLATTGIREFLNRFQRFGLIEKRPNAGWVFKGFTANFALELFEIREIFELRSALAFAALPPASPLWQKLETLRNQHVQLLTEIDGRYHDFSDLDSRFHRLVNSAAPNRFIDDFFDIITLIFHYHYQWNKQDERQRNEVAIKEHLTYIEALLSRNPAIVELACRAHLASAKETLMRSSTRKMSDEEQADGAADPIASAYSR